MLCRLPLKDPWSQSSDSDLPQPRPRACLLLLYSIRKSQASSLIGPGSRDTRLLAPSLAQSHTTAPCHVHQWEQPFCLWTYDASRWMKTFFFFYQIINSLINEPPPPLSHLLSAVKKTLKVISPPPLLHSLFSSLYNHFLQSIEKDSRRCQWEHISLKKYYADNL